MNKDVQKEKGGGDKLITLLFVVNSEPTEVKLNIKAPLKAAVEKALEQTGNTTRPREDWTAKWNNQVLDINKKVEDFGFTEGAEIFLSLKAGEGGNG